MHLSFEAPSDQINVKTEEIEIYFDRSGAELLIRRLKLLLENGPGHDHLKTPGWAGTELSENPVGKENDCIHHVILTLVE